MSARAGKILLVNDKEYGVAGGSVRCAVNYNEFFVPLQQHFAEVHVLGRLNPSADSLPFTVPGVVFHGVPTYGDYVQFVRRYRFGRDGVVARKVLESAIAESDIVLLTVGCFFARDVERICRRHRKPLVVEVIDDVLTAVVETHKYRGPARWAALLMAWRMDRYYRGLCRRAPSLVLGKELYRRYAPAASGRCMEFFENIMEESHYRFGRKLFAADMVRILFVGRLVHMKAVEDLIAAVAVLRDRGTSVECRVVGYGECLDSLRAQVKALRLDGQVTFSGFVKYGDEMFSVYDWADVFVLPSVGGEGVPRVLVEALGRGCLVVATDVCGISTIVQNRVTGALVPPRRPDLIASEIRGFASDPARTAALLEGARDFCLRHTRTKQIGRLVQFIERAQGAA
jgi:glycosyltransferase involved in cell wall biosynthesis